MSLPPKLPNPLYPRLLTPSQILTYLNLSKNNFPGLLDLPDLNSTTDLRKVLNTLTPTVSKAYYSHWPRPRLRLALEQLIISDTLYNPKNMRIFTSLKIDGKFGPHTELASEVFDFIQTKLNPPKPQTTTRPSPSQTPNNPSGQPQTPSTAPQTPNLRPAPTNPPVTPQNTLRPTQILDTPAKPSSLTNPPWLNIAYSLLGTKEIPGPSNSQIILNWALNAASWLGAPYTQDSTPWCGLFIAHCLNQVGIRKPSSAIALRAKWWLNFGEAEDHFSNRIPLGSIAVLQRTGGGHVFFVTGVYENGDLQGIGGNQSDKVSIARFPKSRLVGIRWPDRNYVKYAAPRISSALASVPISTRET